MEELGSGLWISNLWYLNYSDRSNGRITGMSRYASFWVDQGRVVAPVAAMRFDDTLFRILGSALLAVTRQRQFIPDDSTYHQRSVRSARLPGIVVDGLTLTL